MNWFSSFFPPEILVFSSDCSIDFSFHKSTPSFSIKQKKFLKSKIGAALSDLVNIQQTHGCRVLAATRKTLNRSRSIPKADGLITCDLDVPLAIRTADCLSVFIYDPKTKAIGLVHAGWKGTRKEICLKAVNIMKKEWKVRPRDLKVAFGPSLQSCCYEVDKNFKMYFPEEVVSKKGHYYLDLPFVNRRQLLKAGVKNKNIMDCAICTHCNKKYFSYRRDGEKAGRMISIMMRK